MNFMVFGAFSFMCLCGIISAKWALELGYSQIRQLLLGIGGGV